MALEPIQELVRLILEADGYFVRNNVRYRVESKTKKKDGKSASYSDIDILAVKIDTQTGLVVDRIWGETKGHLTSSLTASYLRSFAPDYAVLLSKTAWSDAALVKKHSAKLETLRNRQSLARARAVQVLGEPYRRVLYFGGRKPKDNGKGALALLDKGVELVYVRNIVRNWIAKLTHLEGNEDVVRVINALDEYGLIRAKDEPAGPLPGR
ncbi:MAG TPA: hypothetical protein VJY35_00920 [Candidatus Eisenbacteria bacterium]|nr:hypothetical protein [Candidatus Eisenbacteria bacterium]